jgi:hypothetical protein
MRYLLFCVTDNILLIGFIVSVLYGFFADKIFWDKEQRSKHYNESSYPRHIHQFWLNFVGSFMGWFSIYLFLNILIHVRLSELSIAHILLLGFGIIGIVGWLPMTLLGVATSLGEIVRKLLNLGNPKE